MKFSLLSLLQDKDKITLKCFLCFLCFIFLLCVFGCDTKQEPPSNNISKLHFNIIPDLLGPKIINNTSKFEFNSPKFLIASLKDSLAFLRHKFEEIDNDSLTLSLLYVFMDSSKNNSLLISEIAFPEDSNFILLDKYEKILNNRKLFVEAKKSRFFKDDILISQFIFNKEEYVFIKIVFETQINKLIQFDFVLALKEYKNEVRSVESSIGSIVLL